MRGWRLTFVVCADNLFGDAGAETVVACFAEHPKLLRLNLGCELQRVVLNIIEQTNAFFLSIIVV